MWIRNKLTEEIGWYNKNDADLKNLLVYIKKSNAWVTAFWEVDCTECVEDYDQDPPF